MPSQELIDETIRVWQSSYSHTLTTDDACEIIDRWAALLNVIGDSLPYLEEA